MSKTLKSEVVNMKKKINKNTALATTSQTLYDIERIQNDLDSFYKDFLSRDFLMPKFDFPAFNFRTPLTTFNETDKEITAKLEIPGANKEDIKINKLKNGIEVKVENKKEHKTENKKKDFYEYRKNYSGYYRYFSVPDNADTKKLITTYKNGVLELKMPKKASGKRK